MPYLQNNWTLTLRFQVSGGEFGSWNAENRITKGGTLEMTNDPPWRIDLRIVDVAALCSFRNKIERIP
jgi:hypothetical protein